MNLQPWQLDMMKKLEGFKPGEMVIYTAGRNVGKSAFSAQALKRVMDDILAQPITDILLAEGRVYGARYYTAEPVGGNWREMEAWCMEHFGTAGEHIWGEKAAPEPAQRWYMNNRKFWFRDERDRMIFVLKWR